MHPYKKGDAPWDEDVLDILRPWGSSWQMDSAPSQRPRCLGLAHPDGSTLADGSAAKLPCSLSTGTAAAHAVASSGVREASYGRRRTLSSFVWWCEI